MRNAKQGTICLRVERTRQEPAARATRSRGRRGRGNRERLLEEFDLRLRSERVVLERTGGVIRHAHFRFAPPRPLKERRALPDGRERQVGPWLQQRVEVGAAVRVGDEQQADKQGGGRTDERGDEATSKWPRRIFW